MHDVNLIQIILVALVALVASMTSVPNKWQFHRPLIACTLTSIAPGNPAVGIMVGGSLELLVLGWMNVDATMTPDSVLASTVSIIITVVSIGDASSTRNVIAAAIGMAVPLAITDQALMIFVRAITIFFAHQVDRFAKQISYRGIAIMHFTALGLQRLRIAIPTAVVVTLASGNAVKHALDAIPRVIAEDLGIVGGFTVVVGYAVVINMMKARRLMPFFFLDFIFTTFATTVGGPASVSGHSKGIDKWVADFAPNGATLVVPGILEACLTAIYVQLNPEFRDSVRLPTAASPATSGGSNSNLDDDLDDELD